MESTTKQKAYSVLNSSSPFNVSVLALASASIVFIVMLVWNVWDGTPNTSASLDLSTSQQASFNNAQDRQENANSEQYFILNDDTQICLANGGGINCGSESYHFQLHQERSYQAYLREQEAKRLKVNEGKKKLLQCPNYAIYWLNGEYYGCGLGY